MFHTSLAFLFHCVFFFVKNNFFFFQIHFLMDLLLEICRMKVRYFKIKKKKIKGEIVSCSFCFVAWWRIGSHFKFFNQNNNISVVLSTTPVRRRPVLVTIKLRTTVNEANVKETFMEHDIFEWCQIQGNSNLSSEYVGHSFGFRHAYKAIIPSRSILFWPTANF